MQDAIGLLETRGLVGLVSIKPSLSDLASLSLLTPSNPDEQ